MDAAVGSRWDADVLLADGSTARIRPIRPSDAAALQDFHVGQSAQSTLFRFFAPRPVLSDEELRHLTTVDHDQRVALIVLAAAHAGAGDPAADAVIVGVGRFDRYDGGNAEIAFNVSDAQQGRGVGSILLEHLAAIGRELGVARFTAEVLPTNWRMLAVFDAAGYRVAKRTQDDVVLVDIDLDLTPDSASVMADREWRADVASLARFEGARDIALVSDGSTQSAALVGALRPNMARSVGNFSFAFFVDELSAATLLAAAPDPAETGAAESSADEPRAPFTGTPELALITTSPRSWPAIIELLGSRGLVGAVLYQSAGRNDTEHLAATIDCARRYGVRILGPGSAGFRVTRTDGVLDATTLDLGPIVQRADDPLDPGDAAVFCHSRAVAVTLAAQLREREVRVARFFSAGQRADISGNDFLQTSAGDPGCAVVAMHLESLGNARKLARAVRRVAAAKPLLVAASATAGQAPIPGHRVRTSSGTARTLTYLLAQSGAVQARDVVELADLTVLAAGGLIPANDTVVIRGQDRGQVALVTAELAAAGLTPRLVEEPPSADNEATTTIEVPDVLESIPGGQVRAIAVTPLDDLTGKIPALASARHAARSLAALRSYSRWLARDPGALVRNPADRAAARSLLQAAPAGALDRTETAALFAAYDIDLWPLELADTADEAAAAAATVGYPAALTSSADALRHRADLGAVRLGISSEPELRAAFAHMRQELARLDPGAHPMRVQRMAPTGVACVIRSREDAVYGPVVSIGIAGDAVDLLDDLAEVIVPATQSDIDNALRSLRAARRFFDPDLPAVDVATLMGLIGRVGQIAEDNPEIARLELRPVMVAQQSLVVLDASVELAGQDRTDDARRQLARWE